MSDEKLTQIDSKLDHIRQEITSMQVSLGKQEISLLYHIRRTDILERKLGLASILTLVGLVCGVIAKIAGLW